MKYLIAGVLCVLAGSAMGQTGYTITGGLGNFDCGNHTDDSCDEFEIEIEDITPSDVVHTYHNGNYGSPTVTLSPSGTSTIIDYRNPSHLTVINAIEHFGVSLRAFNPTSPIHVRWMRNGQTATVNGQIPNSGGGGTVPATQPILPSITSDMGVGSTGGDGVSVTVTNNDPQQAIWIKRRADVSVGAVTLEALMPNDPVVTSSVVLDAVPVILPAGQAVTMTSDLVEVEDNQSAVFAVQYYQDLVTNGGPFGGGVQHARGPELGNLMTATITSPGPTCANSVPVIQQQPDSITQNIGLSFNVRVMADGNDMDLSYQWFKDGAALSDGGLFSGTTTDEVSVDVLNADTEGFYYVRVSNACGWVESQSALVYITGHNNPPTRGTQCDSVDFNHDQLYPDTLDIDDFLSVFSGGECSNGVDCGDIDFNNDGLFPDTMDIDALLSIFSGGPCIV